ncbi:hypothetical protein [Streptomyces sp. S1]|uniref:hypothetical protein n=1 Tax=Streptomyces sp. S1 TaxID=718288 RepID=UPI0013CE63AB|nr:hypothetical protein [Streptomyces sp. S1]
MIRQPVRATRGGRRAGSSFAGAVAGTTAPRASGAYFHMCRSDACRVRRSAVMSTSIAYGFPPSRRAARETGAGGPSS